MKTFWRRWGADIFYVSLALGWLAAFVLACLTEGG